MRELPILLNGDMVRATLDGRKTMTRRPITKHAPEWAVSPVSGAGHWRVETDKYSFTSWIMGTSEYQLEHAKGFARRYNPLGAVGDLLYVRETCRAEELACGLDGIRYLADNAFIEIENSVEASDRWFDMWGYRGGEGLTVPSIHMPKWATRTWLRVTGVKVEKRPYISEEDAIAEGFESAEEFTAWWENQYPGMDWRFVTSYEVTKHGTS